MITRSTFLKSMTTATGTWVLPSFAIGQPEMTANSKLNLARLREPYAVRQFLLSHDFA